MPEPTSPWSKPLHRRRLREVAIDVADRLLLPLREHERQRVPVALDQLAWRAERRRDLRRPLAAPAREADLEDEQLVEGETLAGGLGVVERVRAVDRVQARLP